jgi:hypothetical protein
MVVASLLFVKNISLEISSIPLSVVKKQGENRAWPVSVDRFSPYV